MSVITEADFIHINDYMAFCDYIYDHEAMEKEPDSGVVFVHQDNIQRFFRECRQKKYILVSGASDFSLFYQADHHPNTDLRRLSQYCQWQNAGRVLDQYVQIKVGPACNPDACDSSHRYSLKTYCWTKATFPEIPPNIVHWFCANSNIIDDPRISWIPFGMLGGSKPTMALRHSPKRNLLYVNFQLYTDERVMLKQFFSQQKWATTVNQPSLPVERYYQDIAEHKFVLCPLGNGLDCYRNYEVLYLGSIPVMRRTPFTESFLNSGLPVLLVDDYTTLTPQFLEHQYQLMASRDYDLSPIKLSTWKEKILSSRKKLAE